MGNQPMKDNYVGGLEASIANKMGGAMKRQSPYSKNPQFTLPKTSRPNRKKMKNMAQPMYRMPGL